MSNDRSQTLMEIMNRVEGVNLHEKKGSRFHFPIYYNKKLAETPIEALDLGVRAYNSLKRANFNYIGELAEATAEGDILKKIRNCGTKSVREIMEHLFIYQYEILSPEKRDKFIRDVLEMNANLSQARCANTTTHITDAPDIH